MPKKSTRLCSEPDHCHSRPTILVILDGFGLGRKGDRGNAITSETAPNIFSYMKKYSFTTLSTGGVNVGLFPGQPGNSEAGHMNIGAGRVVKQDLVRISESIHDGTFFKNEAFKQALFHVKKYKTAVHILTMLTDGNSAHAYPEHLYAMLEYFRRQKQQKVFLHLITDGRDSSPYGARGFLHELRGHMLAHEKIATIGGRLYYMDRNKIWERTRMAYDAMVLGRGDVANSAEEALARAYDSDNTDEFILPTVIFEDDKPVATVGNNDAIFFVNARSDRARQITKTFVQADFEHHNSKTFHRKRVPKNIRFVAMTDFGPDLPGLFTAFPSPDIPNCLPKVISDNYRQLYISETEKYAHVTYFINGGFADPLNGEKREVVKSFPIKSYAEKPEMNSAALTKRVLRVIEKNEFDFICVNFPNADMVGHTGDIVAARKAVSVVDKAVAKIVEAALKRDGQVLVIADHGNADEMQNEKTGALLTEHSINKVPCVLARRDSKKIHLHSGILSDVAPTLLELMHIQKPREMTGKTLF